MRLCSSTEKRSTRLWEQLSWASMPVKTKQHVWDSFPAGIGLQKKRFFMLA
jgi:hypothetical protein